MERRLVLTTLLEEHLWKTGQTVTFIHKLYDDEWEFKLTKINNSYYPFKYELNCYKLGTNQIKEIKDRRFHDMQSAFLYVANELNENGNIKNKYDCIEDWLLGLL